MIELYAWLQPAFENTPSVHSFTRTGTCMRLGGFTIEASWQHDEVLCALKLAQLITNA